MGFQIEIDTGEAGPQVLRGSADGTVELCQWREVKDKDTGSIKKILVAYKFYASIEQAFNKVARMRIGSAKAKSIKSLITEIKGIRADIKAEMGAI